MPRKARAPGVRSDGEVTAGNTRPVGAGQPNGRPPRSALVEAAAAGAGGRDRFGEAGALRAAVAATPSPPGVEDHAALARVAAHRAGLVNAQGQLSHPNVTPLFAPTERPWEPVTAGAPLAPGPTNPMAMPMAGTAGVTAASILAAAAQASGSPVLQALADRAAAVASPVGPPMAA